MVSSSFTSIVLLCFAVAVATESSQDCPADGCPGAADPEASSMEVTMLQRNHRATMLQDEQAESMEQLEKRKLDLLKELALIETELDSVENATEKCAAVGKTPPESCLKSKCCVDLSTGCYQKDKYWAQCLTACTPGVQEFDPPQYRTPWSCELLGEAPDPSKTTTTTTTLVPTGGNCQDGGVCADPEDGCYEKDKYYARCMKFCVPGYNWQDEPKYQSPWTCKHLSGAPPPATLPDTRVPSTAVLAPWVGIGYNSDAHRSGKPGASNHISCDDFMAEWSEPLWGPSGRNDLKTIADMGFDAVRTYGIGAHLSHTKFLDHAHSLGLKVHPGFADYPYLHLGSSCRAAQEMPHVVTDCIRNSNYDCHDVIKAFYLEKLKGGFAVKNETDGKYYYHPAIMTITVINECELKLSNYPLMKPLGQKMEHAKVVVTAADGILSAEKEMGIVGPRPVLTATASYAACKLCRSVQVHFPELDEGMPALPWMADYYLGFQDPEGTMEYTPKNDLKTMYATRWANSFNTQRPADSFCADEKQVLKAYTNSPLGKVPIFIGEFHDEYQPPETFAQDIVKIKNYVANDVGDICGVKENPLIGFNLFEFQISYWKGKDAEGGIALRFGIFGLGWRWLAKTNQDQASVGYEQDDVWCLCPGWPMGACGKKSDNTNLNQVIKTLGGKWPDDKVLCDGYN